MVAFWRLGSLAALVGCSGGKDKNKNTGPVSAPPLKDLPKDAANSTVPLPGVPDPGQFANSNKMKNFSSARPGGR